MNGRTAGLSVLTASVAVLFLFGLILGGGLMQMHLQTQQIGTIGADGQLKPGAVPAEYAGLINQAAHTCPEITAPLLAAQLKQESGFNPAATSPVGAVGLAQFMPSTWSTVGHDYNGDGRVDPRDPGDAIPAQAHYMCDQVAQIRAAHVDGDLVDLSLAAYNAGTGAVTKFHAVPPYPETQAYVRRIRTLATQLAQPPAPPANGGSAGNWVSPAAGRCSSGFGPRWGTFHKGQDLAAPIGTPIVAASDGTVIAAGPATGFGLWVKLQHPDGVVTVYGHNDHNLVTVGQQVHAGEPIAAVGDRGEATGPHLHYQVEQDGHPVDPVDFQQQHGAPPLCTPGDKA